MSKESLVLAKAAALKKNFDNLKYGHDGRNRVLANSVDILFPRYFSVVKDLKVIRPELYNDIPELEIPSREIIGSNVGTFGHSQIQLFVQNLDYILELSANIRIGDNVEEKEKKKRVFISHGRSNEWTKVQNFLERDLEIQTLELAQEPNLGRTILRKLYEESQKCSVAVIVMTGEDISNEGEIHARENVMHEIGFFQAKYGLTNVVLLHEQDVNIPSNIHGLVYIPFPKNTVEATLGALTREMRVLIG